ncbi:MAG: GNAT family N-acetyltransferase [Chloroflexota bacterium]
MYTIRPFIPNDHDYTAVVANRNAARPDHLIILEHLKHSDSVRNPDAQYHRYVVVWHEGDEETIVGDAAHSYAYHAKEPGLYGVSWIIHPDHDNDEVNALVFSHLQTQLARCQPPLRRIITSSREDKPVRVAFLEAQGFDVIMRSAMSQLTVTDFDFAPFADAEERFAQTGIRIVSVSELMNAGGDFSSDWKQKLYTVANEIVQDVPSPEEFTEFPKSEFEKFLNHPYFCADAWFVALDEGGDDKDYVGLSFVLVNDAQPEKVETGLTGVVRSHRRRNIATILKLHVIRFAQDRGIKVIETDNEENNPMYQLNLRLGFEPIPASMDFAKEVAAEGAEGS